MYRKKWRYILQIIGVVFGALLMAVGFNFFLLPHGLLSGGVAGISMILSYFTPFSMSAYYLGINIPLVIAGWFFVGRRFIVYSLISVLCTTFFLRLLPLLKVLDDPLLSAVYAGVVIGAGAGVTLRAGGSAGGMDILGAMISRIKDMSIGTVVIYLNTTIVLGYALVTNDWNQGLASAVTIYVSGKVVNFLYMANQKVTVHIITDKPDPIIQELLHLNKRGITVMDVKGAYSDTKRTMLMTVVTQYELLDLKEAVFRIDPNAFMNITQTLEVVGNFHRATRA